MGEEVEIHTCLLSCVFRSGFDDTCLPCLFLRWGLSFALELIKWLDGMAYRPRGPFCFLFPSVRIAGVCREVQVFYVGPGDRTQVFEVSANAFTS